MKNENRHGQRHGHGHGHGHAHGHTDMDTDMDMDPDVDMDTGMNMNMDIIILALHQLPNFQSLFCHCFPGKPHYGPSSIPDELYGTALYHTAALRLTVIPSIGLI
jgi:hypothetical protein